MQDDITTYVGLDVHKGSIAIAVAEAGRSAPRFVGTCARLNEIDPPLETSAANPACAC